jgi:glycosyltransferase involved in cell wall biosynthesis
MPVRVALLTPFAPPSVRGNAITVGRVARGLRERGVDVRVWDLSAMAEARIEAEVEVERPAVIHAFHALRSGPLALRLARRAEIPLVVTLTGTDANHDLFDPERAAVVRRVLEGAAAIVAFHDSIARRVTGALPDIAARLTIIPQAAVLDEAPFDLGARFHLPEPRVLFLFPGGIRPVKRPRLPLAAFRRLVERRPLVRLAYAGPVIDPHEGEALLRALDGLAWARHLGAVPHARMASLMRQSDVVLNCSESEGGMANAVLEAMLCGRAVLAADIEGNRSLVEDGVTGLLFRDDATLLDAAERLVDDPDLRARLADAGRARVLAECPPEREIDGYVQLYQRLVRTPAQA